MVLVRDLVARLRGLLLRGEVGQAVLVQAGGAVNRVRPLHAAVARKILKKYFFIKKSQLCFISNVLQVPSGDLKGRRRDPRSPLGRAVGTDGEPGWERRGHGTCSINHM